MAEKTVKIPSMACGHCLKAITDEISSLEGVAKVKGDVVDKNVTFFWDSPATWELISKKLKEINYPAE